MQYVCCGHGLVRGVRDGELEAAPLAGLAIHALGALVSPWQPPDDAEVLCQASHEEQVQDTYRTCLVAGEDGQRPLLSILTLRKPGEHGLELLDPAPTDPRGLKVVGHEVSHIPLAGRGILRRPTHLRLASLVLWHEGGQCQRLVKVKEDEGDRTPVRAVQLYGITHQALFEVLGVLHKACEDRKVPQVASANAAHVLHEPKVVVPSVVPHHLAVPEHLDPTAALEVGALVIHEDDLLVAQLRRQRGSTLTPQVGDPLLQVLANVYEHVRLVVRDLVDRRVKGLPLVALAVGPVGAPRPPGHAPHDREVNVEARNLQQAHNGSYTPRVVVSREDGQSPWLPIFPARQVREQLFEPLDPAAVDPRRLEVHLCGKLELVRRVGAVLGHEGGQGQGLVEVEDHQLHAGFLRGAVELPLRAADADHGAAAAPVAP
mmetsp:Transcript_12706/g.35132  ORF Transcript_12706/g.35132 Transcript_12706/m.35132 type:complete len:431 (+) Transcript_12706:549-1841(+)